MYAAMYVFIKVFVRMLDTVQYIIMIISQMFIVLYVFLYLNSAHHIEKTLTICMSHCYHVLYSLQYNIRGLCDAAGDGRLEDVKVHLQNGVDVNGRDEVSNYIYTYFCITILATHYIPNYMMLPKAISVY